MKTHHINRHNKWLLQNKKVLTCISCFGKIIVCLDITLNSERRRNVEISVISWKAMTHSLSWARTSWVQPGLCDLMIKLKLHVLCINCKPLILCCNHRTVRFVNTGSLAIGRWWETFTKNMRALLQLNSKCFAEMQTFLLQVLKTCLSDSKKRRKVILH